MSAEKKKGTPREAVEPLEPKPTEEELAREAEAEQKARLEQRLKANEEQLPQGKRGKGARDPRGTLRRVFSFVREFYPVEFTLFIICIVTPAILQSLPSIFLQNALAVVGEHWESGDWAGAAPEIGRITLILCIVYVISVALVAIREQLGAKITQGTLMKLRNRMFEHMESLPISYFDTHKHGDIMSYYTNDVDALRQMISQALPNILTMAVAMVSVVAIMFWYSLWLSLVVIAMVGLMGWLTSYLGSKSARFFLRQQRAVATAEGFVQEAMAGQKVIKVFTHEDETEADFDILNEELFQASRSANIYSGILGPVLMNLGNLAYVVVALAGGIMLTMGVANVSLSGLALTIDVAVPFLNLTKRFAGSIGQISHQINFIVMGLAGAERLFDLLDEEPEVDEGYVTLVNVRRENGEIVETDARTGQWAWRHPHQATGEITYTPLEGDVRLFDVDFAYSEGRTVLHDISLYAKPGQKVAFVGATGAGKTTITNLLNRFYDIADGKIRYDGININKIKKADLRHSLGIVLQDVNLFTGTVMDNIRYGRLEATDEECIAAAKLAGADSFITRLPQGYATMLTDNGAQLSQGQRQLLSIARAAVADPPVMILDEATSSIDTRTEQIVQRGMDALMAGRTSFVIAHRLSTVRNADVIIVLERGRIIERGTHDDLIAAKGTYYQLYTGAFELE